MGRSRDNLTRVRREHDIILSNQHEVIIATDLRTETRHEVRVRQGASDLTTQRGPTVSTLERLNVEAVLPGAGAAVEGVPDLETGGIGLREERLAAR
nr:hypothetical protein [Acidipropionibacterium timonense]